MKKYTEFTGRTVEEAIEEGLAALGLTEEDADVRVLETGKKKLFGYSKARVEIAPKNDPDAFEGDYESDYIPSQSDTQTPDENAAEGKYSAENNFDIHRDAEGRTDGERAVEFIEGLFDILRITACTELTREEEKIEINVTAANTNSVIGKRGAMIDAIQTIAGAVANTGRKDYKRVVVDCENYRENREETLQRLARRLAEKAVRFEKKIRLEPMNPYERRIIHAALADTEGVTTQSEGKEPRRYVVIVPDNVRYPDRPASPARGERGHGYNNRDRGGYNRGYKTYTNRGYSGGFNRDRYNAGGNYNRDYNGGYNRDGDGYRKPYRENQNGYNRYNENGSYNRDYNRDGNRPYNRDQGGYNRYNENGSYNRDYNREGSRPYNRDQGGYNRDRYNDGGNYNRDRGGDRNNGRNYSKPYDKSKTSYKKPATDFFGTYLGNSRDGGDNGSGTDGKDGGESEN